MQPKKTKATLNIGGDTVKRIISEQVQAGTINQDQSDLVWWYFAYAKTRRWSLTQASGELGYGSNTTLFRLWNGTYGAKLDNICSRIARYKAIAEERAGYSRIGFIETNIARRIFHACEAALISQTVVIIYGDSQIGKTRALMQYAAVNNHGQTKYIRMPASAGVQIVAKEIARACFVSAHSSFEGLRERIMNAIDANTLMIFDEMHQPMLSYHKSSQMKIYEFIREIYDRTGCGMVLCGTNVFRREIQEGKLAQLLEQLRRRCTHPIQLPSKPPRADIDLIAKEFGLKAPQDAAFDVIKGMIQRSGLGMYIKFLQAASRMAGKAGEKLSWDHFVRAHDIIAKLGQS